MAREKKSADNPPKALIEKVLAYSEADNWEEAKFEWEFYTYYYVEEYAEHAWDAVLIQ